mgnify:CR=1 FL=1
MNMSFRNGLVSMLVNQKKYEAIREYLQIEFPNEESVMVLEYAGERPRLFKNTKDEIVLMLPDTMDTVMENAVTRSIEDGTIFDDAKLVDNSAQYLRMTALPVSGMAHKGYDEPKALKSAVGSVIGTMNDKGRFGNEESDMQNGFNAMHDMVNHANDSDDATFKLVGDYIKLKDGGKLPIEYRRDIGKVKHDVKNVNDVECEDCIGPDDYRELKLTDECGSVCAIDEEDAVDMSDTSTNTVDTSDIDVETEYGEVEPIDEETLGTSADATADDDVVEPVDECGDEEFDESFHDTSNTGDIHQEGFLSKKPKKLKPIPRDIIPYITIEMNNIKDSNDQAMLAGYTCSKLELVDFYLNCIDTQDDRYIVPHTRQYLVQLQSDLNRLLAQILRVRPMNKMDRIWKANVTLPG